MSNLEAKDRYYNMLSAEHGEITFLADLCADDEMDAETEHAVLLAILYACRRTDERLHAIGYKRIDEAEGWRNERTNSDK